VDRSDCSLFRFAEHAEDIWSRLLLCGLGVPGLSCEASRYHHLLDGTPIKAATDACSSSP
jgi:hypothetical protein